MDDFGLARYWQAYQADFYERRHAGDALIRVAPGAGAGLSGPAARALAEAGTADPDGWTRALVPIESAERACRQFLALGPDVEVIGPPELRAAMAATASAVAARHDRRLDPTSEGPGAS